MLRMDQTSSKKNPRRLLWISLVLAPLCAIIIQLIPYPYKRISGNLCDNPPYGWCYEPGWKVGIPFAWSWGSIRNASLSSDDDLVADVVICTVGLWILFTVRYYVLKNAKQRHKVRDQSISNKD